MFAGPAGIRLSRPGESRSCRYEQVASGEDADSSASSAGDEAPPVLVTTGSSSSTKAPPDVIDVQICGRTTSVPRIFVRRAILLFFSSFTLVDQYLDGAVLVSLMKDCPIIAMVLAASIVAPQVLTWMFLHANNMMAWSNLARILTFPMISVVGLLGIWLSGADLPEIVVRVLFVFFALSPEPWFQLAKGWQAGQEQKASVWASIAEGLQEAPCSCVLTLYPAMLKTALTHEGLSWLFVVSSAFSIASITRCSVKLHFYGEESPQPLRMLKVALRDKLPSVASQVLAYATFAFLTRPLPRSEEELYSHSSCYMVFIVLAQEFGLNFAMLRAISPSMRTSVALLFASSMVVTGPPGFLKALDAARPAHGLQHFLGIITMASMASLIATDEHWHVLMEHYLPCAIVLPITAVWSFITSQWPTGWRSGPDGVAERLLQDDERLDEALLARDRIMAGLMLDVENAEVRPGYIGGKDLAEEAFIPTTKEPNGQMRQWSGIAELGGRLYCCPYNAAEVLVLDPAALDDQSRVSFIDTGKGEGGGKWHGIAACGDRLYCCPFKAEEVLVIHPRHSVEKASVSFIPVGKSHASLFPTRKGQVSERWAGIVTHGGRLYCCPHNAAEVLVIDPAAKNDKSRISFIPTGRDEGSHKWSGIAALGGRLYCCPDHDPDVLVVDPAAVDADGRVSFIPTQRAEAEGQQWCDIAAFGSHLYCCPSKAAKALVIDPAASGGGGQVTFVSTGKEEGGRKWHGITVLGRRLYCCPHEADEVLVIEPAVAGRKGLTSLIGGAGNAQWCGIAAHREQGVLYCCPDSATEVLKVDPCLLGKTRQQALLELGLQGAAQQPPRRRRRARPPRPRHTI